MTLDFDEFAAQYRAGGDLEGAVAAVRGAVAHPVHSTALDGATDTIAPLLDRCGVPASLSASLTPVQPSNTRLRSDVLLELLGANRAYPDRAARKAAKQDILSKMQRK